LVEERRNYMSKKRKKLKQRTEAQMVAAELKRIRARRLKRLGRSWASV
jgi:hypothetical protein